MAADTDALAATWAAEHDVQATSVRQTLRASLTQLGSILGPAATAGAGALPRIALDADVAADADLEVVRVLGGGGMGEVLLARQRSLGREIAIKRARALSAPDAARRALVHEARVTGALEHPNVIPVHALGKDDGDEPLLLMKRVEGTSLQRLVHEPEHPAWAPLLRRHADRTTALVDVLIQVCNALELAHSRGVVHRDIKPENVMVGAFGEVYLLDWGIAAVPKHAGDRVELVGTPAYMAPEMASGRLAELDARTDVFLLGATLHEILTRHPRHAGASVLDALRSVERCEPCDHDEAVPRELAELCRAATARDPGDRPQSAAELRDRLAAFLRHGASRALTATAASTLRAAEAGGTPEPRALTECRFAFAQALRDWPENHEAREGLDRTLRLMIEAELARESPVSAEALLAELSAPDPALAERIRVARARHEETLENARKLEGLRADMDPSVSRRARIAAFGVLFVTSLIVGASFTATDPFAQQTSVGTLTAVDTTVTAVFWIVLAVFWRKLSVNTMSRRVSWMIVFQTAMFPLLDLAVLLRQGAIADAMVYRSIVVAGSFFSAAALSLPALYWLGAMALAGGFAVALLPVRAAALTGFVAILLVLAASVYLFGTGRIKTRPGDTLSG